MLAVEQVANHRVDSGVRAPELGARECQGDNSQT